MKDAGTNAQAIPSTLFLQRWYNSMEKSVRPSHLVVLIQDVESMRSNIVQDMVRLFSSATTRNQDDKQEYLPICLVMGFATTTDAVTSVLTHRERSLIVAQRFTLQPARRTLNSLLDSLLDGRDWSNLGHVTETPGDVESTPGDSGMGEPDVADEIVGPAEEEQPQLPEEMCIRDDSSGEEEDGSTSVVSCAKPPGFKPRDLNATQWIAIAKAIQEANKIGGMSEQRSGENDSSFRLMMDDHLFQRFLCDSTSCARPALPIAVSLPQFSESAMGQLVDNAFYCNFEIDSFRKHIAFGINHHFFRQPLSYLCRYIGGGCAAFEMPTLSRGDIGLVRKLKSVSQHLQESYSPERRAELNSDDEMQVEIQKWLMDLRKHFSRLPLVLRLLHQAFSVCAVLKRSRLEDTIRYVQQYLVSAEEQSSREMRGKLMDSLKSMPIRRLLLLVQKLRNAIRAHIVWVDMHETAGACKARSLSTIVEFCDRR